MVIFVSGWPENSLFHINVKKAYWRLSYGHVLGGKSYLYIQTDCFKDVDYAVIPVLFQLLRLTKTGTILPFVKQFGDPQNNQISFSSSLFFFFCTSQSRF